MRTFVRLRQILASHAELARKLEALEKKKDDALFPSPRDLQSPHRKLVYRDGHAGIPLKKR